MVRLILAPLTLLAVLVAASAAPSQTVPPPATTPTFAFSGRGWGHGVGMSQYGALGFAQRGHRFERILAHYYRGTELGRVRAARLRVLLLEGRKALTVSSAGPVRVRDATGAAYTLEAGRYTLGPGLRLALDAGEPRALPSPLVFVAEVEPLALNGKRYRGTLEISVEKGKLRAINGVGLEAYLNGVVPDEVPSDWPAEALKAQAVVARSYALAVRKPGPFHLYADVRSQVYGGLDAEESGTTAAVQATAGQVVTYAGKIATTYFFSTSGGRTANVADVWSGTPIPYLVSVPDPYDDASPHHMWGPFTFATARLTKALDVPGRLLDIQTTLNASGRVATVVAVGTEGESSVPAGEVRRRLGLRSTWFHLGALALEPSTKPLVYGSRHSFTGLARGLPAVTLEQRSTSTISLWEKAADVTPGPDGRLTLPVKPEASTDYRLVSGTIRSARVRLAVAPLVRIAAPTDTAALRGIVKPLLPGATAVVQRLEGTAWREVARAPVDETGTFEARFDVTPGTYRARVAPGRGLVPGVSASLDVAPA
jgi:stage II sporulation protein D